MDANSGSHPQEAFRSRSDEDRKVENWFFASDHLHRAGRQAAALRAGGLIDEANKVHEAAVQFINLYDGDDLDRQGLTAVYRMAKMEDTKKSLWMGAWRW